MTVMRPATPAEIEAQRAGYANYTPGPRNCMPMRTPYVSIDIETTGLDPTCCQVIEFGAVIDNWVTPVEELPRFHCYVLHNTITGQPFALQMNAAILKKLATVERAMHATRCYRDENDALFLRPRAICGMLHGWLQDNGIDSKKAMLAAGKNFASFDRPFLNALPGWDIPFYHRVIDPAMLFWRPDVDEAPPSSKACMERAGIPGEVAHTAVEDAIAVIKMVRAAFAK